MTYKDAVKEFKQYCMTPNQFYDYGHAFEMWSIFVDGLCKDKQITDRQWNTWRTPFRYGKTVAVDLNGRFYYKKH